MAVQNRKTRFKQNMKTVLIAFRKKDIVSFTMFLDTIVMKIYS